MSKTGAQLIDLTLAADLEPIIAQVQLLGPALAGALSERMFQLTDHHRRSVLKHNQFPSGREGMKAIAAGLHRYGRRGKTPPTDLRDVVGESFASFGASSALGTRFFRDVEEGRTISTAKPMAVPISAVALTGTRRRIAMREFWRALKAREYIITKKGYILRPAAGMYDPGNQHTVNMRVRRNARTTLVGVLTKRRRQRPILGFYDQFNRVWPKHKAKMDQDVMDALRVGGAAQLGKRSDLARLTRIEYKRAYNAYLARRPGDFKGAVTVAKSTAKAVRMRGRLDD